MISMPPFVSPPNPPALIQTVAPVTVNAYLPYLVSQAQSIPIERDDKPTIKIENLNPQRSAEIPTFLGETLPPADNRVTLPQLVEVYYINPKEIPPLPLTKPFPAYEGSASLLGSPISVGQTANEPVFQAFPSFTGFLPALNLNPTVPNLVVLGLQKKPFNLYQSSRLIAQARGEAPQEFPLSAPAAATEAPSQPATVSPEPTGVVELISDHQEYDSEQQIVYAEGNVVMRFDNAVLLADRLRVNLPKRVAVAEGKVILQRGDQTLRGERFEYYFVQDRGIILNANGELYQASTSRDFAPGLQTDVGAGVIPNQVLSERLALNQPLQRVTTTEGYRFVVGAGINSQQGNPGTTSSFSGGQVNRLRFEAERVDFDAQGWNASQVRITNDPFSPPELEIRAETATYRNVGPLVDEVRLTNSQVVLDQENAIPTFQDRLIFDRHSRQPGVLGFGYDGQDRGGFYIQRAFSIVDTNAVRLELKPQYLLQKALSPNAFPTANPTDAPVGLLSPAVFGLIADLDATFSQRTNFRTILNFSSLNLDDLENHLRSTVYLQQKIGDLNLPHDLFLQYYYRERLFNGSLGYQTVNNSVGAIIVSPVLPLGNSGFNLSYQGSIQNIQAPTDRPDLLPPNPNNNLVTLMRYQGAASVSYSTFLWLGQSLPPTPEEGLHYTSTPILPYIQLATSITGVAGFYSSGDSQPSLTGSIGLLGQFGHFSQPFFDYTGFNITYNQAVRGGESPFFFDRYVDTQTLSWGLTQQVYGPIRIGVQSSFSFDANEEISTDYFIEYTRRTYDLLLRYNPILQVGSFNLRISDFNWSGNPGPFEGTGIRPVIQGVTR